MVKALWWLGLLTTIILTVGCTTAEQIRRPNGDLEYVVGCGASLGWNVCYGRATELCPYGYDTISEQAGFNRKELRISCPTPVFRKS